MLKGSDIVTLIVLSKLQGQDPSLKGLADLTCSSISQVFDSLEKLYETGLVDRSRKEIITPHFESFFIHAIPFVVPGSLIGPGKGRPLSISDVPTINPLPHASSHVFVWSFENEPIGFQEHGLRLMPLTENLNVVLEKNPDLINLFSLVEILRFHQNPLRDKACERLKILIKAFPSKLDLLHTAQPTTEFLERISKIFAESGFNNNSLEVLAEKLNFTFSETIEKAGSMRSLQKAIGEACASRAYAHFGKALFSTSDRRLDELKDSLSVFFDFLDVNEDYFRLGLWFYLENLFKSTEDAGILKSDFFSSLESFFDEIPSTKSSQARAALFANSWLTYAWFRWVEYPRMPDPFKAKQRLSELKKTLVEQIQ